MNGTEALHMGAHSPDSQSKGALSDSSFRALSPISRGSFHSPLGPGSHNVSSHWGTTSLSRALSLKASTEVSERQLPKLPLFGSYSNE